MPGDLSVNVTVQENHCMKYVGINSSLLTQRLYCDVILLPRLSLRTKACQLLPLTPTLPECPLPTGVRNKAILLTLGRCDAAEQKAAGEAAN